MLVFPGDEKNERHTGANGGIGDVECGETNFAAATLLQIEAKKIHHFLPAGQYPVGEIPGNPAKDQAKRNLAGQGVRIKMVSREKQGNEREQGYDGQRDVVAAEKAPSCARVAPVNEFEKAINDDFFVVGWNRFQHQPFGGLVQRKDHQRQRSDAPVRFLKDELSISHKCQFPVSNFKFQANLCPAPPRSPSRFFNFDCEHVAGNGTKKNFPLPANGYSWRMALVRILVDGYSLLHEWPELAPGQLRHSERARNELIHVLTRYHDATGTPVTVFFDGAGAPRHIPKRKLDSAVEVLFSCAGQTADQMIERAAHGFSAYGETLVVTDDRAERAVVSGLGASVASCTNFIRMMANALTELQHKLWSYNCEERRRFKRLPRRNRK